MAENCKLNHFRIYCNTILETMKNYITPITDYFNNSLKLCKCLLKEINGYKDYLDNIDYNIWHNPKELFNNNNINNNSNNSNNIYNNYEDLINKYESLNEQISKYNNLSKMFEEFKEEFKKISKFEFLPEDESAFDFEINSILKNQDNNQDYENNKSNDYTQKFHSYDEFVNNYEKSNDTNSKIYLEKENVCSNCGKNNIKIIDRKNKKFYCNDCYNELKHKIDGKEINQVDKDEIDKISFLNSIEIIIKYILLKCNDILNEKEINKNKKIIKEYPKIADLKDQDNYVNFLNQINDLARGNSDMTKFSFYKLNNEIIKKFGNIYKQNLILSLNLDPNSSILEDDSEEGEFINEVCDGKSEKSDENENVREVIDEKVLNNYYYFINIISKDNLKLNENITIKILHKLNINPENFLASSNNKYFIDNLVRTDKFLNLSLEQIKNIYPNLQELYEYKNIVDYLIRECNIKDYIDCRGNFIIKINNKDNTKERYYPPYEWIGIGFLFFLYHWYQINQMLV